MVLPRFILAALVASIGGLTLRASAAEPTSHPSDDVILTSLDDPTTPSAKCYLSLQSSHQSTFGESSPDDLNASRAWIRKKGVDVMSESREPVQGFVAYDMVLVPTDLNVYDIAQYETVQTQVRGLEAEPFQAIRLREGERKTYLFRTRDGSIGAMDATLAADHHPGIRIRYRIIPSPPVEDTVPHPRNWNAIGRIRRVPNGRPGEFSLRDALSSLTFDLKVPRDLEPTTRPSDTANRFTLQPN